MSSDFNIFRRLFLPVRMDIFAIIAEAFLRGGGRKRHPHNPIVIILNKRQKRQNFTFRRLNQWD